MTTANRRQVLALGITGGVVGALGVPNIPAAHAFSGFKDVPSNMIFAKEINWLGSRGIVRGWSDGTYRPFENIKRDALAAFLYRISGEPAFTPPSRSPFRDVPTNHVFYKEIAWCKAKGILKGWNNGTFQPNSNVLRDAAATVFYRLSCSPNVGAEFHFKDTKNMIFKKEIYWARKTGMLNGWADGKFRPLEPIKRDAMAALIYRYMNGGSFGKGISVNGAIAGEYFKKNGIFGRYNKPQSNEKKVGSGWTQNFSGGIIGYKSSYGAIGVTNPSILRTFKRDGSTGGKWGYPTSWLYNVNGATFQNFEGGTMRTGSSSFYVPNDNHSTRYSGPYRPLKYGTSSTSLVNGTRVRYLWESMRSFGYVSSIPRTSSMTFNWTLRNAVIKFQKKARLKADGVVGPKTWDAINRRRGHRLPFTMDDYIAPTEKRARGGNAAARIEAMRDYFRRHEGRAPYTWGGAGYTSAWTGAGFDCSGLVYQMMAAGGIVVNSTDPYRHAQKGFRSTQAIYNDKKLRSFPLRERRNGDIITFANSSSRTNSGIRHAGIYYDGYLYESWGGGTTRTRWNGGVLRGNRYPMPLVKRPFW